MPTHLDWLEILLRLALTLAGGAVLGLERSEHSRPAGLRTVLLVCLAASLAMILANLLIDTQGRPASSFVQLDMMRLPLGILTGVGFIGAGAIVRRDDLVLGVTTAATLWFASVVGLCFGAGRLGLGIAGVGLGFLVLTALRRAETLLPQDHRATLVLVLESVDGSAADDIRRALAAEGFVPKLLSVSYAAGGRRCELRWDIAWSGRAAERRQPDFLGEMARRPEVLRLSWRTVSLGKLRAAMR